MLTVPPGAYPLRGFAYLCSHPNVNARVGGFLAGASALCMAGILALAFFTFRSQLKFVGHSLIGVGVAGKVVTCCLILAEASIIVYLVFQQTMQILQRKLFTMVLHGMFRGLSLRSAFHTCRSDMAAYDMLLLEAWCFTLTIVQHKLAIDSTILLPCFVLQQIAAASFCRSGSVCCQATH